MRTEQTFFRAELTFLALGLHLGQACAWDGGKRKSERDPTGAESRKQGGTLGVRTPSQRVRTLAEIGSAAAQGGYHSGQGTAGRFTLLDQRWPSDEVTLTGT